MSFAYFYLLVQNVASRKIKITHVAHIIFLLNTYVFVYEYIYG